MCNNSIFTWPRLIACVAAVFVLGAHNTARSAEKEIPFKFLEPIYKFLGIDESADATQAYETNIFSDSGEQIRFVPDNLFAVDFHDSDIGWAAGYYGTILKTEDSGASWRRNTLPHNGLVRRISFANENTGWAVTHHGRIYKTDNGGETWRQVYQTANGDNLRDIFFVDESIGWAVGHMAIILRSSDGGETWQEQELKNYTGRDLPRLNAISARNDKNALIAGEFGVIAETTDGGESWNIITDEDFNQTFTSVDFYNEGALVIGLDGAIAHVNLEPVTASVLEANPAPRVVLMDPFTNLHLFDVEVDENGDGAIVGAASVFMVRNGAEFSPFPERIEGQDYVWFGGVTNTGPNKYISVGRDGLVTEVDFEKSTVKQLTKW